jgi:hypothetical protein
VPSSRSVEASSSRTIAQLADDVVALGLVISAAPAGALRVGELHAGELRVGDLREL